MLFFTNAVQHNSTQVRGGMIAFNKALQVLPCVNSSTTFWYSDLISWVNFLSNHSAEYIANGRKIPDAKFAPWLHEFLAGIGKPHHLNVVWESPTVLRSSRILGSVVFDINSFSSLVAADTSIATFSGTFGMYVNRSDLENAALAHSPVFGFGPLVQDAQRNLFVVIIVSTCACPNFPSPFPTTQLTFLIQ